MSAGPALASMSLGAGRSDLPSWPGCRVPSHLPDCNLALPIVGNTAASPAGLELSFECSKR